MGWGKERREKQSLEEEDRCHSSPFLYPLKSPGGLTLKLKHRGILGHREICPASIGRRHDWPLTIPGAQPVPLFAVAKGKSLSLACQFSVWLEGVQTNTLYHIEKRNYAMRKCVFVEVVEYVYKLTNQEMLIWQTVHRYFLLGFC